LSESENLESGVAATPEEDANSGQESKDVLEHEHHLVARVTTSVEGLPHAAAIC
jgi:hypothetical protein